MSSIKEHLEARRSIRKYTGERVSDETLDAILAAAATAPSAHAGYPWELLVIRDKEKLAKLAECRSTGSAKMLAGADCAVLVMGRRDNDMSVEDCSAVLTLMNLAATANGAGACWIQVRLRDAPEGVPAEGYIRKFLTFPADYMIEAILSIGMPAESPARRGPKDFASKIHREEW